jgi:AAA family ATPase
LLIIYFHNYQESFDIPEVGITHFKLAIDRVKPSDMKFYQELAARFSRFVDDTEKAALPGEHTEPAI